MAWGPNAVSASRVARHLFWPWLPLRFGKACVRGAQPPKQLSKKGCCNNNNNNNNNSSSNNNNNSNSHRSVAMTRTITRTPILICVTRRLWAASRSVPSRSPRLV